MNGYSASYTYSPVLILIHIFILCIFFSGPYGVGELAGGVGRRRSRASGHTLRTTLQSKFSSKLA